VENICKNNSMATLLQDLEGRKTRCPFSAKNQRKREGTKILMNSGKYRKKRHYCIFQC
jgi:hypothetical protein